MLLPSSHWSKDAAHMLSALLGAGWHVQTLQHSAGCSASLAGHSSTKAAVVFSPSLEEKSSLSPAAGTGPTADTDSSHFQSPSSDIPCWMRCSDALQRTRVARQQFCGELSASLYKCAGIIIIQLWHKPLPGPRRV